MTTPYLDEIEAVLKGKRVSIAKLCRDAQIDPTTWQRWKNGAQPRADSWDRLRVACFRLVKWKPPSLDSADQPGSAAQDSKQTLTHGAAA